MNLPNAISFGRLLLVPVIVWLLLDGRLEAAFWVFVLAGASDALDGFLARRLGLRSALGGFLDPLADKALLVSVFVTLGHQDVIPLWLSILVVFRDLVILAGMVLFQILIGPVKPKPLFVSKVNTAAQIVLIAVVLAGPGLGASFGFAIPAMVWAVAVTSVVSGAAYVIKWSRKAAAMEID